MLAAFAVAALVLWLARFAFEVYQVPWNAYAMWDGAILVIDHMKNNNGEWPKNWQDLDVALQKRGRRTHCFRQIEDFQRRLEIDFDANPIELAKVVSVDGQVPFRVIRLRNGKDTHWAHAEPNDMIHRYLTDPAEFMKSGDYFP